VPFHQRGITWQSFFASFFSKKEDACLRLMLFRLRLASP
jgi:hypothetical protein